MTPHLIVESDPTTGDIQTVITNLRAFNVAEIGPANEEPVHIFIRDDDGVVVGGLIGHTKWEWLYVSKLWVSESLRGQGRGGALLDAAEELARSRGCVGSFLDTFEFQARPFYEKKGYELFGTLEGYPAGRRQFFLAKRFNN